MTLVTHAVIGYLVAKKLGAGLPHTAAVVTGSLVPDLDWLWAIRGERSLWGHRGITHHFTVFLLCTAVWFFGHTAFFISLIPLDFLPYLPYARHFCLGYALHILADVFNPSGIPYGLGYYPRFRLSVVRVGSFREVLLCLLLLLAASRIS